jgi:PAS domain S-box-containing protein
MVLSAEPETIQKIESVNAACCQLLGYSKTELMEKNLSHILPEFILVAHQELLTQRSREILYTQEKNLSTLVYAVTSSGYLVESRLSIMQLNSITGRKWRCTF